MHDARPPSRLPHSEVLFWIAAWLGTLAAGGMFGLLEGELLGLIAGLIWGGMFAFPIHITTAILTWTLWLSHLRVMMAGVAGAFTGVTATHLTYASGLFNFSYETSLVLAGFMGAIGSVLAGRGCLYLMQPSSNTHDAAKTTWQFSLRDLFVRVAVLAVLLAVWTLVINSMGNTGDTSKPGVPYPAREFDQPGDEAGLPEQS